MDWNREDVEQYEAELLEGRFRPHWAIEATLWPCPCDFCMRAEQIKDQFLLNRSGLKLKEDEQAGLMIDRAYEEERLC